VRSGNQKQFAPGDEIFGAHTYLIEDWERENVQSKKKMKLDEEA